MTTPPDRALPLPPEHAELLAAGWQHTAYAEHHTYQTTGPSPWMICHYDGRKYSLSAYVGFGCVSVYEQPTHAVAMQGLRDVAAALLALPEVPQ
jgi:hypothetical protein